MINSGSMNEPNIRLSTSPILKSLFIDNLAFFMVHPKFIDILISLFLEYFLANCCPNRISPRFASPDNSLVLQPLH